MSIGSIIQDENIQIKRNNRMPAVKKPIKEFFEKPIHYLFYFSFFATMVGLFCGMEFCWQYYCFFVLLLTMKIVSSLNSLPDTKDNKH